MSDTKAPQGKLGQLLQTNKSALILELVVVFTPMYLGLAISVGSNHIPLDGNMVIMGGPLTYLGLAISIVLIWIASRLRGPSWRSYGLKRPKNWFITVLKSLGVALVVFGAVIFVIYPILNKIPNLELRDMSHFDVLTGNLPNLLINIVLMWITAGFLEEFLWRGYLMERLIGLFRSQTKLTWAIVILVSATIFGLGHGSQGVMGILKTGAIGLVFGISFLVVGRNLLPLFLAHALIDSLDFITHYFGG